MKNIKMFLGKNKIKSEINMTLRYQKRRVETKGKHL